MRIYFLDGLTVLECRVERARTCPAGQVSGWPADTASAPRGSPSTSTVLRADRRPRRRHGLRNPQAYILGMHSDTSVQSLSDQELLRGLQSLLHQARRVEADIVAHIGEVDARRLFAREAAPSMFVYCTLC